MVYLYWGLMCLSGAYFLNRRIDFYSIAFFSCCVYFSPAALPVQPAEVGAYLIYFAVLLLLVFAAVLSDRRVRARVEAGLSSKQLSIYWRGSLTLFVPLLLISILGGGGDVVTSKLDSGQSGLLHYALSVTLGFFFACSVLLRRKAWLLVCLFAYGWIILHGDRTQFVLAVISVAALLSSVHRVSPIGLLKQARRYQIFLLLLAAFVGVFGKNLYGAYFDHLAGKNFVDSLAFRTGEMLSDPAKRFEAYHVQSILNQAIKGDDRISADYLLWTPVQILPFAGEFGSDVHYQSEAVKALYFSDWSDEAGVSSNFFAEGYLLWGYLGAFLFVIIYVLGTMLSAAMMRQPKVVFRLVGCFGGAFWVFYLHRSSLFQILAHEKRVVYGMTLVILVCSVLKAMSALAPKRVG